MNFIIDPVAFQIGGLAVKWYGIIIGFATILGLGLVLREAKYYHKIKPEFFLDFFIYGVPVAIVCARLYYVIFNWKYYSKNPVMILALRQGGIAIHGAIFGGLFVLIYLCRKRRVNFWESVDILAPAVILGQAIGRWGNFINQEAHGGVISQEFISHFPEFIQRQMYINGRYYHPTFLYESLWDVFVFIVLIILRRKNYVKHGDIFATYLIGYSTGRFFIEGMRTDSLMFGPFRVAQLVSIGLIIIGLFLIYKRHRSTVRLGTCKI
nr:prolipoprotein diacylglyceryl transferase [Halothermothrix orenii]